MSGRTGSGRSISIYMKLVRTALAGALGAALLAGCNSPSSSGSAEKATVSAASLLTPGPWHGELATQGQTIPFLFEVKTEASQPVVYLINKGLNGEERLRCDVISAAGDSVTIRLHVFDAALVVHADGKDKLKGAWVKYDSKTPYRVPLVALNETAYKAATANDPSSPPDGFPSIKGTWRVTFKDEKGDTYPAVGIFQPDTSDWHYRGTFLTTTGDYRYLSGYSGSGSNRGIQLSTFDGSHAFLFTGHADAVNAKTIKGDFYSGKGGHETWTATLDPTAKLPDADTLTYLKKGESRLNFKFPSIVPGASISPTDPKYRGKVVVLQVLGSWCPNCMDETKFLAPWYAQNKARGVEVIGLGYERMSEYEPAAARLRQMKERLAVSYDLAVAGVSNKDSVAKSMPQLAKFLAFPTTIFLDKKGVVRSIHTGFAGPGTGKYYEEEKAHFNRTVDKLLKE
jgi:thiol-disulfide isomerase/thioredoxin